MNKILNLNQEEFKNQVDNLVQEIKSQTQDNLIEGIIEEIATNRLIYQKILTRLDVIDNQLMVNNLELPVYVPEKLVNELVISADFPLSAENGFYELEYDSQGRTMRWTGLSKSFFFDLCFDRLQPKRIVLDILSPLSEKNLTGIKCFIDDIEATLLTSPQEGLHQFTTLVPANKNTTNTKISFLVPELVKPCELDANQEDGRDLGVVFYQLSIQNLAENN
ncbi:MAG: hypothetical protein AAGA80_07770 [Cyanobacteria bacterium P01_F01_bin.143]